MPTEQERIALCALRVELKRRKDAHSAKLPDLQLLALLTRLPDTELAACSLLMYPRPRWVIGIVGDHPIDLTTEMHHPEDRADAREWGGLG